MSKTHVPFWNIWVTMASNRFHDRFLIIDGSDVYHIGASLKDLGKKLFAFSKLNIDTDMLTATTKS
jgi:hypothetical protein